MKKEDAVLNTVELNNIMSDMKISYKFEVRRYYDEYKVCLIEK